ncbi:MGMT family protein [Euzebya pacifica]|uniref:MGMT family protein n=1 Tax=Euzebya pacifica TaxID=1608957 RepID=UPI0030F9DA59
MTPAPPGFHPHPDPTDLTPFQQAVVDVVTTLREGEVATYAEVADDAGHPGAGQAVANVLRRVPDLPWWRVVPAGGRLYRTHAPTQAPLLRAEGVELTEDTTGRLHVDVG